MSRLALAALATLLAQPAIAHVDGAAHGTVLSGLSHPLGGADHLLAMVAVGLWAAALGGRAVLRLPAAFVGAMLAGFALSRAGVALPLVEPMILASVLVSGLLVATAARLPAGTGAALVALFGLFHGAAHSAEMGAGGMIPFALGFVLATAALHTVGAVAGRAILTGATPRLAGRMLGILGAGTVTAGAVLALA